MRTVITKERPDKVYRDRLGCWHAYFEGRPEVWEAGATPGEAIEKLRHRTGYKGEIEEVRQRAGVGGEVQEVRRPEFPGPK